MVVPIIVVPFVMYKGGSWFYHIISNSPVFDKTKKPDVEQYQGCLVKGVHGLHPGDIVVKYCDDTNVNNVIKRIQEAFHKNDKPTWFIHAGIVVDHEKSLHILEMDGNGLKVNDLLTTNLRYEYEVFRLKNDAIRKKVVELAAPLVEIASKGLPCIGYNYLELDQSIVAKKDIVTEAEFNRTYEASLKGKNIAGVALARLYCSQFVVWLFQGAKYHAKSMDRIWYTSEHVSPAILVQEMKIKHPDIWTHVGWLPKDFRKPYLFTNQSMAASDNERIRSPSGQYALRVTSSLELWDYSKNASVLRIPNATRLMFSSDGIILSAVHFDAVPASRKRHVESFRTIWSNRDDKQREKGQVLAVDDYGDIRIGSDLDGYLTWSAKTSESLAPYWQK